jgi:predicted acylesterase/phospholipase RssA
MTIKHLVLPGGGPIIIQILAALQELDKKAFLDINNIESIYGTSAGAIMGLIISLKFDWDTINDYFLKRPWHEVFPIHIQNIIESYNKRGIFDNKTIEKCFKPFFDAKDIPLNINLQDLYNLTKIELHMFAFEVNKYTTIDISYKTYPNLPILTAIQMSCALPILVAPVCIDGMCIMDGCVESNYPLNFCINSGKNIDEILGFKNEYSDGSVAITEDSTLFDYIFSFIYKAIFKLRTDLSQIPIKYEIKFDSCITLEILKSAVSSADVRRELFDKGRHSANNFLENIKSDSEGKSDLQDS